MTPVELAAAGRVLLYLVETPGPLDTPCWVWPRSCNVRTGYGQIHFGGRKGTVAVAHRLVYRALVGEPPAGYHLHHRCENPACANPYHLAPLTPLEHASYGKKARTVKCPEGHPYDKANTGRNGPGGRHRRCLECHRIRENARYHERRAA